MRSSARRMTTVEWMDTTVKPPGEATSNNQTISEATALSHPPSHPWQKPSRFVLNLYPDSAVLGLDFESFRWQETTFAMLNLALLAALLCGHALFSEHFGTPTPALVGLLSTGFLLQLAELIWMQTRTEPLTGSALRALTAISIIWDVVLAVVLGLLIDRVDSLIFLLTGVLVWFLVNHLRRKEIGLAENLLELTRTREQLLQEEKLAAVGRLSAAIAHEIRNPVAMISSSLATAIRSPLSRGEREEMFDIAAKEADRLERLTNDFLAYAKPRAPEFQEANVMDTLAYVAGVCRAHALRQHVDVRVEGPEEVIAWMDAPQLRQALLNLAMNAVEASGSESAVVLRAQNEGECVRIDLENGNGPISDSVVPRIFEPFFTTKLSGTGLGLAIADNIVRAHSGLLLLTLNTPETVRFTLTLPRKATSQ